MRTESFSIRGRIFALAIVILSLSSVGLFLFLQAYAQRAANRAFDRVLAASALTIAGAVRAEGDATAVELPYAALAMLSDQQRIYYSVRDTHGRLITGYDDLDAGLPPAASATPVFADRAYRGATVRVGTLGRLVSPDQRAGWVTIRVAETREAREALAAEILRRGAAALPIMAGLTLLLLWLGIRWGLAPLRSMGRELRQRKPDELHPLSGPVPREVRRLVEALNGFMQRLQEMLAVLNNLVADAAHQVRTPLASLRAQAEVALDETDARRQRERLERIHQNAILASNLVNQLLMDATITHRLGLRSNRRVRLADIVNDARQRVGAAQAQRLHIAIAPDLADARIVGDRVALREMLRNLVDNAMQHAPGSPVDISARHDAPDRLLLEVADRGPGIADADKARMMERFVRGAGAQAAPGSGLGLAIARTVAERHGGALVLRDRPGGGLVASVRLAIAARGAATGAAAVLAPALGIAFCLGLCGGPGPAWALDADGGPVAHYAARGTERAVLTVAGPTDTPIFAPLARGFQREHPDVALAYHEIDSSRLYELAVAGRLDGVDLLISSAMDLQLRLANDGLARRHQSAATWQLPRWANWRSEVFGFTFEPIVMIYNTDRYSAETAPHSRSELLALLERSGPALRGRIATYDIAASSLGHLLATQDERISTNFWGLANALGGAGVRLFGNTVDILSRIESGALDLGYNVLGSYVRSYRGPDSKLGVVMPDDYQLFLTRAVLILHSSPQPELAGAFIDWLLSPIGQEVVEHEARLGALPGLNEVDAQAPAAPPATLQPLSSGIVQPMELSPALLVGLDRQRYSRFLQNWQRLVTDTPVASPP